jgi:predicted NBD/HSP70 family sugar kinase
MKIGVDLGGTNIRAGLIDGKEIVNSKAIPLQNKDDLESTLEQLKSIIHTVFKNGVKGIWSGCALHCRSGKRNCARCGEYSFLERSSVTGYSGERI